MYAGVYPSPWIQVLFRLSAALSIFGSSWILTSVIRDRKNRNTCYHRLLFGLSVFDLLSSIGFFAGTWAQSKSPWLGDDNPTIAIIGNAATCDASGFVIYMGSLAIPWYNAALNVHYYLAVCQGWKEQKMKKQYERYVHICIIPVAIIIATIPLFLQLYNPYHFYCFIAGRVYESAHKIFLFLYVVFVIVCSAIINLSVLSVTCYVRKTSNKSQSYSFTTQGVETPGVEPRRLRRRRKLTAEVKIMAFLYSVPFMITWLIPVLWITCVFITLDTSFHIVPVGEHVAHNIANIYIAIFVPLQGFFNWLVYVRPRLKKVIARIRNKGSLLMLKTVETISSYYMLCFRGCKEAEEDMDDDFYGGAKWKGSQRKFVIMKVVKTMTTQLIHAVYLMSWTKLTMKVVEAQKVVVVKRAKAFLQNQLRSYQLK